MRILRLHLFLIAGVFLGISGCATRSVATPAAEPVAVSTLQAPSVAANYPAQPLTAEIVYYTLLGDVAQQRGVSQVASAAYLELAKTTRDPRILKRAAQLALEARQPEQAMEVLQLWQNVEPDSLGVLQAQVSLWVSAGQFEQASQGMERLLHADPQGEGRIFLQLHALLQRAADKPAALAWLQQRVDAHPEVAEARWALASLAHDLHKDDLALDEIKEAIRLRPDWDLAVVFAAQLEMVRAPDQALARLAEYLQQHPERFEVRLYYARALLEHKRYEPSRTEFLHLQARNPDNAEIGFAIALISLQLGDLERAERELEATLNKGAKDPGTVHYYLAQLHEARNDFQAALGHYQQVLTGEYVFSARVREAQLHYKQGNLAAARAALVSAPKTDRGQAVQLIVIEAQMLREQQLHTETYAVLQKGLERFPDQPQLLFEAALAADKLKKYVEMEKMLRRLLELQPKQAHVYNALGYSFLERNINIEEGFRLVQEAYRLDPEDPAITDSMGWGYYRVGDFDKSLEYLRRAYRMEADPEIATHLIEVLLLQKMPDEARSILEEALKAHPDDARLLKLKPEFQR